MIIVASEKDKKLFDQTATHPLQSWDWGEFRKKTGVKVSRLINKEGGKARSVFQITWHKIPLTQNYIGYCPKSVIPSKEELAAIKEEAQKQRAIMVKFEPNEKKTDQTEKKITKLTKDFSWLNGKPLFTKYTFQLNISEEEEELLKGMQAKTRYNLRLAEKKGVKVIEDNSEQGFEEYWKLTEETTKRQGFFAHTKSYHQKMWQTMTASGIGHLFRATYNDKTLATWMIFILNGVVYYPYGASSSEHREVMASNLMMWEVIKYGKEKGCRVFDMWGSLGPKPDTRDPWYGFHRFKQGYGGELVEFLGSFDLVISPIKYRIYRAADWLRWLGLKLVAKVRK